MMNRIFACLICVFIGSLAFAQPQPQIVQRDGHWTLDVQIEHPMQIAVYQPGQRIPLRFWYTIITLTNNTKSDQEFFPTCELMTDTFQLIPAGRKTPKTVFQAVKKRYQRDFPYLELLEDTENRILQGEDNTRDIAIIWPDFDPNARAIDLYIAGLSNENVPVNHPTAKDKDGNPVKIYLRKTLQLNYTIGGDPKFRSGATLVFNEKSWIMR
jgi:hypothetical protein